MMPDMPEQLEVPQLSPEELLLEQIMAQPDAVRHICEDVHGIGSHLWVAYESPSLGRRVTVIPEYMEITEPDTGEAIGHAQWGQRLIATDAGESVALQGPVIVGTRKRGE